MKQVIVALIAALTLAACAGTVVPVRDTDRQDNGTGTMAE